ncbi:MAG TPA: hypothetical protein VGE72_22655 [Azospirillum sp.]
MAKRGQKPLPPSLKAARGTEQPCRDVHAVIDTPSPELGLKTPVDTPLEVAVVWEEYVEAAVAHGARQCDADSFAEWCTMTANLRKARASGGDLPPASYIQQWRTLGELFGLAGPKSRVLPKGAGEPHKPTNPFARNGRRG